MSDFYTLLEVDPEANADQIRRAYYRMARLHHPDLQGSEIDSEANERFLQIQEAYEVLGTPLSRQKYDEQRRQQQRSQAEHSQAVMVDDLPGSGGNAAASHAERYPRPSAGRRVSLDDVRKARQAFMRAEEFMESGDIDKVVTLMQAVVRVMDDEPEYISLFGYALALKGKQLHKARDCCRRASEAEPTNLEFRARLGYVYHRAGLTKTADAIFDEVLAVDPNHPIARPHHSSVSKGNGGLAGLVKLVFGRS